MTIAFDVQTSFGVTDQLESDSMARPPGTVRDAIVHYLASAPSQEASVGEIRDGIEQTLGDVASSSIRSYLNLNTNKLFERTGRGRYRLKKKALNNDGGVPGSVVRLGQAKVIHVDCFDWLAACEPSSVHAVVTDPPYGLVEYTEKEQLKLRKGRGGVWRIPPSFDGHRRAPLPRFTTLDNDDRIELYRFFKEFGSALVRVAVPGANVLVASNPLLSHIVASAMAESGLELRGYIARLTMTMRGGDRPKNAHREFDGVSVMPRSMWEPWVVLRKPLDGRVQDNLRKWHTGGFRRLSAIRPFGDVIRSNPTPRAERSLAPHPSLKPQEFLRQLVQAVLPLGRGVVLDPFAGSGSTLAAANAVGYESIGLEKDETYYRMATMAIPALAALGGNRASSREHAFEASGAASKRPKRFSYPQGGRLRREGDGGAGRLVL
jgi:site-specific DNA-methyltransferase (adenine-specific)